MALIPDQRRLLLILTMHVVVCAGLLAL